MTAGHIYFAGYKSVIKLGKSIRPKKRIANINGANPNTINLYVSVATADMTALESRLHAHFAHCRREGKREWYNVTHELRSVVAALMQLEAPTEFDLAWIMGSYHVNVDLSRQFGAEVSTFRRLLISAEHRQIEQWAQSYAIGAMKFSQYPAYMFRYNEAMEYLKTLEPGEVPVFITDQYNNLVIPQQDTQAETDAA